MNRTNTSFRGGQVGHTSGARSPGFGAELGLEALSQFRASSVPGSDRSELPWPSFGGARVGSGPTGEGPYGAPGCPDNLLAANLRLLARSV